MINMMIDLKCDNCNEIDCGIPIEEFTKSKIGLNINFTYKWRCNICKTKNITIVNDTAIRDKFGELFE